MGYKHTAETFCNLYPDLCFEIEFPALRLTQNCYLHYNINILSLKTVNLIINWLLSVTTCHCRHRAVGSCFMMGGGLSKNVGHHG